jgi:Flp pilus assembly protein TadG
MRQRIRGLLADRRGATAAEFGMILPALLVMLLGIVESSRAIWTQSVLHYAVEHAARCASVDVNNCGTTSQVQSYAVGLAAGVPVTAATFTVTTPACGSQVSASYAFETVVSNLLPYTMTLTARSCFPK